MYVLERFDVSGEQESLIERVELLREGNTFVCRTAGGETRVLDSDDVPTAIAGEPALNEIRANQVTRIKAAGPAFDELPFVLRIQGETDDFDKSFWSETMLEEHISIAWDDEPPLLRVAYVNGVAWSAYPTDDGPRMFDLTGLVVLGDESNPVRLWAELLIDANDGSHSEDTFSLGLMTELAVVASCARDAEKSLSVKLWRRDANRSADAAVLVDWLLDWIPEQSGIDDEAHRQMLAQLFVEVAVRWAEGEGLPSEYLAASHKDQPAQKGDAVWTLYLDLPRETLERAAALIRERDQRMAEIVNAAEDPDSPPGRKRKAALESLGDWVSEFEPHFLFVDDDDDDDPDAPWNRNPVEQMPTVIEPGRIGMRFWKSHYSGNQVAYDFIFTWGGGREAEWYYDIGMDNPGLSVMSSAPIRGTAKWKKGDDVKVNYSSVEFGLNDKTTLKGVAPMDDALHLPRTWVDLGQEIASFVDGLIA